MKNRFLLTVCFAVSSFVAMSQQIGLSSQYLFNEMIVNPGAAGTKSYSPINLNFRKQWVKFPDSPTSQYLSAHTYLGKNIGIGGVLSNEVAGPSRHTGLTINGAYQLRLSKNNFHRLSMGMGLSIAQHLIDPTKLTTYLPEDPAVMRGFNNIAVPDANVGFFYYFKDKGFAGLSARNLVQMKRDLYQFENPLYNPLVRNYYFIGGYTFTIGRWFDLKTTGLFQMIETGTWQADGSLLGIFAKRYWIGGSYRHGDAVVFMGGVQLGNFKVGYSYDYTLSDIASYSVGSHEIMLELQLNGRDKTSGGSSTPWLKRNRIYKVGN